MRMKKCNSCKRELQEISFTRKDKIYSRCNECSENSSNKKTCRYKNKTIQTILYKLLC